MTSCQKKFLRQKLFIVFRLFCVLDRVLHTVFIHCLRNIVNFPLIFFNGSPDRRRRLVNL